MDESREGPLADLLLIWEERRDRGEPVTPESLCAARPDLLDELSRRVRALVGLGDVLATAAAGGPASATAAARGRDRASATAKAEFRDLRFHAEGGLGEVYAARHDDLGRDVALKFLKPHRAADPDSRRRFLREAEITGRLEHPGVVPVYGLRLDDAEAPCYAMRFIRGETLRHAIDALHAPGATPPKTRSAAFRSLLRRFVSASNTVAYAHSRGVVHRDIKPQNIMIGPFDETLVVDWGLAKSADTPEPGGEGPALARGSTAGEPTAGVAGTPAYMSPEQAAGDPAAVGPAADIYGLGATLYAILTGRSPASGPVADVLARVRAGEIPRPRQVAAEVPKALEAVCLKAMATRPADRYASALDLAADVERWIADEPVSAWREPAAVRLRRWLGRHRQGVAIASVTLVAATATLGIVAAKEAETNRALRASSEALARERDAANRAADRANRAFRFLTVELLASDEDAEAGDPATISSDPMTGAVGLARGRRFAKDRPFSEVLDLASARIAGRFASEPEDEADVRDAVGGFYRAVGQFDRAESQIARAGAIRRSLPAGRPGQYASVEGMGRLLYNRGRYEEAEAILRPAIRDLSASGGAGEPTSLRLRSDLALVLQALRRFPEAESTMRAIHRAREATLGPDHPLTLKALSNLATMLNDVERVGEAEAIDRRLLAGRLRSRGADDPDVILSKGNLAADLFYEKAYPEAEALLREALDARQRAQGEDHPDALTLANNLALLVETTGRVAEAEALYRRCLRGRREALGEDSLETVTTEVMLATLIRDREQYLACLPMFRHATEVRRRRLGGLDSETLTAGYNYASILMMLGRWADSEAEFAGIIPGLRRLPAAYRIGLTNSLVSRGRCLVELGRPAEAEAPIREGLRLREAGLPAGSWPIASARGLLGACLSKLGRHREAGPLLVEAAALLESGGPREQRRLIAERLAAHHRAAGPPAEAARWSAVALDLAFPADVFTREAPAP